MKLMHHQYLSQLTSLKNAFGSTRKSASTASFPFPCQENITIKFISDLGNKHHYKSHMKIATFL